MFFFSSIFSNSQIPKRYLAIALLLFSQTIKSQNLIPNPSFEEHDTCYICASFSPFGCSPLSVDYWNDPVNSAEYFNSCSVSSLFSVPVNSTNLSNFLYPRTGNAYAGINTSIGEQTVTPYVYDYLQTKIQLFSSHCYYFEYYTVATDSMAYAITRLGAYFSKDSIYGPYWSMLSYEPQIENTINPIIDNINWQKISGTFIANGDEKYVTIGCFRDSLNAGYYKINNPNAWWRPYYYIDDVSLYDVTIQTNRDTIICSEQTTKYNLQVNGAFSKYTWSTGDTTLQINVNQSGMYWVKGSIPNIGDFYDTVYVTFAKPPTIAVSNDTTIYSGTSAKLIASGNYQNYIWSIGINSPNITVSDSGIYTVEVYDYYNCKTQKSVSVKTIKAPEIPFVLPTIIHLKNEKLIIKNKVGLNIPIDKISIYNTLGQVIFESTNYANEFPNIPQAKVGVGMYYYSIKFGNETVTSKLLIVE
jgi:hypothetical protein